MVLKPFIYLEYLHQSNNELYFPVKYITTFFCCAQELGLYSVTFFSSLILGGYMYRHSGYPMSHDRIRVLLIAEFVDALDYGEIIQYVAVLQ